MTNKTARIICTMDQPAWYYWLMYSEPSTKMLKKTTLEFCGIKPVKVTSIGPIRLSKDNYRNDWINKVEQIGSQLN